MNNIFESKKIEQFKLLCASADRIAIVSHTNPDGDAIGSGMALLRFLRDMGHEARFFVPNRFPEFLEWVDPQGQDINIFSTICNEGRAYIAAADLIICVDFNQTSRLELMTSALDCNIHAARVLIDHHQAPPLEQFVLAFADISYSSTSLMIFCLIEQWASIAAINRQIAEPLYLGMMTDTGCFSFANLTPQLYRAVAVLVESGIDVVSINRAVFDTQSADRLRLVGYLLSQKMVVAAEKGAAYITLTSEEKTRFNHKIGDTEGIVNMPLTIKGINFSAILIQTKDCIKMSFRSQGDDIDVNQLARLNFNGGGHRNAAGGKLFCSMEQAVQTLEAVINTL